MRVVRAAFAALVVLVFGTGPVAGQDFQLRLEPGETLLQIEAEGEDFRRPDVMTVSAGVTTTGATVREAVEHNAAVANRVIDAVRELGIVGPDIRTVALRIAPRMDRRPRDGDDTPPRILGYIAENRIDVAVRDLSRAPILLSTLTDAGANDVNGPTFSLSDEKPARLAAQRLADQIAREEAENYAATIGMRVARIMRVSDRGRTSSDSDGSILVSGSRMQMPRIEPGETRTQARVWVDFALVAR